MENLGGFSTFPAVEALLRATIYYFKSEIEGFRFPDEKLIHFLHKKRLDPLFSNHYIKDIDHICKLEPWDLPRESEEQFWYFFYEPKYKYKQSNRVKRRTNAGYWTITGKGSKIKAKNGLTGSKKILIFYRHGPDCKKEKTEWIMHEFHVNDHPNYKKEFVLCSIERKWDNKHGVLTPDEGQDQSTHQLVSPPTQLLSSDHMSSFPGNLIEPNTPTNLQLPLPNNKLISNTGNHIVQDTLSNPQPLSNHGMISYSGDHIGQTTLTNPQTQPDYNLTFYPTNPCEVNTLINPEILPNHNPISFPRNHIEDNIFTELQEPPNSVSQILPNQHLDKNNILGEFNAGGGYNGLDNASFPTLQSPVYPLMELLHSNSSIDDGNLLNPQNDSEQANSLINSRRACPDDNSLEETGQTPTPDFNLSKSDGSAYAEIYNAWLNELLEDIS